jgi:hypothetical protein
LEAILTAAVEAGAGAQDYGIMEMEYSSKDLHIKAVKTCRLARDSTALHLTALYLTAPPYN